MRPIAVYSALRVGIFLASLLLFVALGARPLLAVVLAAVVSLLLSFVVLRRQRDEVTRVFQQRREQQRDRGRRRGFLERHLAQDAAAEDAEADAVGRARGSAGTGEDGR